METAGPLGEKSATVTYEDVVRHFLRYVLLRSTKYTNNRDEAETIVFYTFVGVSGLPTHRMPLTQLGSLIDSLVDEIGRHLEQEQYFTDRLGRLRCCQMLFEDGRIRRLAEALNSLDGFAAQLLVLYHVETMTTREISQFYNKSIADIRRHIYEAERKLAQNLGVIWQDPAGIPVEQLCSWLLELGEALDLPCRQDVAGFVMQYLAESVDERRRFFWSLRGWHCN